MSAGSKTPGGYAVDPQSLEQFEISDERSPSDSKSYFECWI
jgi:2-iminoacetate synthase